jgi:hypothetical protein
MKSLYVQTTDFEEGLFERQNKVDMFSCADRFKRLHTFGSFIGTVVETTKNLLLNMDTPYFNPNSVAARVEALAQIDELMLRPRGVSLQKLCKDWYPTEDTTRRIEPNLRHMLGKLRSDLNDGFGPDTVFTEEESELLNHIDVVMKDRTVLFTSEGHICLSYHPDAVNGFRPGDILVGLFGANIPFILRPLPSGKDFQMINVAYVFNHVCCRSILVDIPEETPAEYIWNNLEQYGLREYTIA